MKKAPNVPVHQESNKHTGHKILCPDMASNLVWGLRMWQQKLGNFGHASTTLLIATSLPGEDNESCKQKKGKQSITNEGLIIIPSAIYNFLKEN